MPTPYPNVDPFSTRNQDLTEAWDMMIYPDGLGVAADAQITPLYIQGFRKGYISALMADVLHRWNLGRSMVELADRLGTDHSQISRALHWGELSPALEAYLLAYPGRPADWEEPIKQVYVSRHRSAFMGVAEYLAGKAPSRPWHFESCLGELHAELLFEMMDQTKPWSPACGPLTPPMAEQIIAAMDRKPDRDVIPLWYTKKRRRQTVRLIARLKDDVRWSQRYLSLLRHRWEGPFLLAWAGVQHVGWIGPMGGESA